jgi:hypothetical protein
VALLTGMPAFAGVTFTEKATLKSVRSPAVSSLFSHRCCSRVQQAHLSPRRLGDQHELDHTAAVRIEASQRGFCARLWPITCPVQASHRVPRVVLVARQGHAKRSSHCPLTAQRLNPHHRLCTTARAADARRSVQYKSARAAQQEAQSLPNPADKAKSALPSISLPSLPSFGGGDSGEPKKSGPGPAGPQFEFDTQSLWPLGLVAVGGALFALPKIDKGFDKMFETAWVKARYSLASLRAI